MSMDLIRASRNATRVGALFALSILVAAASPALAVITFDQNVTPDAIFGSGNVNGFYTVDTVGEVEIGLRAKLRYNASCVAENTFNSNGDGTYSFAAGQPVGACAGTSARAIWSYEWSVNTDNVDAVTTNLDDYTYEIGLDYDPSTATSFCTFEPITPGVTQPFWDHSIGNNSTANGAGAEFGDVPTYTAALAANNVAQNSWRYEFHDNEIPCGTFDANVDGTYTIYLLAKSGATVVARSEIKVIVGAGGADPVPASSTLGLILMAVFVLTATSLMAVGVRRQRSGLTPSI